MPSVREFFVVEAGDCLDGIERVVRSADDTTVDANELLRICRVLRGSAQLAREEWVYQATQALEAAARAIVSRVLTWDGGVRARALETIEDLRALVQRTEPETAAARVARVMDRWRRPGVRLPSAPGAGGAASSPAPASASPEFLVFAAREVSGILAELDAAIPILAREPRGRERLKAILRRQRKLLGAEQLAGLPAVAETLRAIDEVCRLIARLDVAVEGAWLDVFRSARDVLAGVSGSLRRGGGKVEPAALGRLRHLRDALFQRYGGIDEPRRAPIQATSDAPSEVAGFFRTEAAALLDRIERMADDLARAEPARATVLRRELVAALAALRDTAQAFGFATAAEGASVALARAQDGMISEVLLLLPGLRAATAAAGPAAPPEVAGGTAPRPQPEAPAAPAAASVPRPMPAHSPPAPAVAPPPAQAGAIVPVESLFYRGESALRRALELRAILEPITGGDPIARDAVEELIDLLRVNLS
ncbi:MAG TPA: hypothetical protein VF188_00810 [Longimicrobiales bacterium]